MDKRQSLQQVALGELNSYVEIKETRTHLHIIYKNKLRWCKDLTITHDTIKLLGENIGKIFLDINFSSIYLY